MSETKQRERSERKRVSLAEIRVISLLLRNINKELTNALGAKNFNEAKLSLRAAQVSLETALELIK